MSDDIAERVKKIVVEHLGVDPTDVRLGVALLKLARVERAMGRGEAARKLVEQVEERTEWSEVRSIRDELKVYQRER